MCCGTCQQNGVVRREQGMARPRWELAGKAEQQAAKQEGGHLVHVELGHFGGSGLCTSLLRMLWMCENLGLWLRSFCQQSSMSWWRSGWQFTGAGKRNPSSTAFITCSGRRAEEVRGRGQALQRRPQANPWGKPPSSHPACGAAAAPPRTTEPPARH